jgi:hypothetical protein
MPYITLELPKHKMPLIKEFLQSSGIKATELQMTDQPYYTQADSISRQNLPKNWFSPSRGWEYFINELEYE